MPSKPEEILIRRKRRRITLDPCISGRYFHTPTGDETTIQVAGIVNGDELPTDSSGKRLSSDSAPHLTSPVPVDPLTVVTVDDFLRHQANQSSDHCKTTYSHRRPKLKRHIASSPDLPPIVAFKEPSDSDSDYEPETETEPNVELEVASSTEPASIAQEERKTKPGRSTKARKKNTRNSLPFSKRILRAAILTGVDPEDALLNISHGPVPLQLVPIVDTDPLPPRVRKRARPLDIHELQNTCPTFSDSKRTVKRRCRPFLEWDNPLILLSSLSDGTNRETSGCMHQGLRNPKRRHSELTSQRTALKLVPFTEHDDAMASRFFSKKETNKPRNRLPMRTFSPSLSTELIIASSPIAREEQATTPFRSQQENQQTAAVTNNDVVTLTSPSPISERQGMDRARSSPKPHNDIASAANVASFIASQHQPPPSQKPLHEIGSLLNTLIQTARSISIAQPNDAQALTISDPIVARPKSSRHQRRPRICSATRSNFNLEQARQNSLHRTPAFRTIAAKRTITERIEADSTILPHGQGKLLNFLGINEEN